MIYCFDIDGTICTSVENSDYESAMPIEIMKTTINNLYESGNTIKFFTARGCVSGKDWTEVTKRQLDSWGFKYHELIMNKKPHADCFVDDRGIDVNSWISKQNQISGLIAGAFDLIHPGYIKMFEDAKTVCNHLIVALHADPSLDRNNKLTPINSVEDRKVILSAIKFIDEIVVYETEQDLENLIKSRKPNYRILGTDYANKKITGEDPDVQIYYHKRDHDWSYTKFRNQIRDRT